LTAGDGNLQAHGLPIGLQIVGPMFGDALVLRAARAFESVCPVLRPGLQLGLNTATAGSAPVPG
jgi:hypothetical protein